MNSTAMRSVRLGLAISLLVTLGWILSVHAARPYEHGLPTDWTHQHVIFSQPRTAEQAAQAEHDPRYWQQWIRQHMVRVLSLSGEAGDDPGAAASTLAQTFPGGSQGIWSQNMGAGATVGAGNFPAKYSLSVTTATCSNATHPDFVVFPTGLASSGTKPSILAYDNLYSGCSGFGTVPTVYWSYNTTLGTTAQIVKTSPVISLDGSQIAFVQTDGTHGAVILLRWAANSGTLGSPVAPTNVAASSYVGCTAPCMTALNLMDGAIQTNDTISSVYYDYTSDTAWVGDNAGLLHKFTPFFNGTPTEATSPWPVQVNTITATALTNPVYDYITNSIFTADLGGYLERTNNATGVAVQSARLDQGVGIPGPILDVIGQKVYAFISNDGSTACTGSVPCAGVFQFSTTFAAGSSGSESQAGVSKTGPRPLYPGAFDSTYYNSSNVTGNLYVCGNTGAQPILYQIPIAAGVMPATATPMSPVVSTASTAACSPIIDVSNPNLTGGSEERIFLSVGGGGRPANCAGVGCVESFIVTPWTPSTNFAVGQTILVNKSHIEIVSAGGKSSTTTPAWPGAAGQTTTDGTVTWIDQGAVTTAPLATWHANGTAGAQSRILDPNGNIEIITKGGTSGSTQPTWPLAIGGTVIGDGTINWINAGPLTYSALVSAAGASGIIIDNIVSSATMAGGSQVYFSTLANMACTTGGTGGCAEQASQTALK